LGPSEGSIFLRDCKNCIVVSAAQQLRYRNYSWLTDGRLKCHEFRLRDCQNLKISLFSSSEPVIETSKEIKFWTFHLNYKELQGEHVCFLSFIK
jgi:protein XRP2